MKTKFVTVKELRARLLQMDDDAPIFMQPASSDGEEMISYSRELDLPLWAVVMVFPAPGGTARPHVVLVPTAYEAPDRPTCVLHMRGGDGRCIHCGEKL